MSRRREKIQIERQSIPKKPASPLLGVSARNSACAALSAISTPNCGYAPYVRICPIRGMIRVMNDARSHILSKLRTALEQGVPFPAAEKVSGTTPVTSLDANQSLVDRFITEVERVKGIIHSVDSADAGLAALRKVLTENQVQRAMAWDAAYLPFDGVHEMLASAGIEIVAGSNEIVETAQAGITGCDWAIAATGTLVLSSGAGRSRSHDRQARPHALPETPPNHRRMLRRTQHRNTPSAQALHRPLEPKPGGTPHDGPTRIGSPRQEREISCPPAGTSHDRRQGDCHVR